MASKTSRPGQRGAPADAEDILENLRAHHGEPDTVATRDTLDLVLYSHLTVHLPLAEAARSYQRLKTQFVDWNEVRISTAREVQEVVRHADEPLELALFIKEFLNRVFTQHHRVSVEFLREYSLSEVRTFFKRIAGFGDATVHTVLAHLKEYPVLPLESWVQPCAARLGLVNADSTPLQKQKDLYGKIPPEHARVFHLLLMEHAREVCGPDDEAILCGECVLQKGCPYPRKRGVKKKATKKAAPRAKSASRNGTGKKK